ncbi:hypothetical protein BBF96_11145 [Anoxybacter fermentans]|uniref:Flagellar hook-associated protein 2 n=1 Tax=Anoxybacter fermentans TaxID=1323375 RepID=A0A3S9T053_9FIRM|nr:flagellar filament capping protein FliD [Anoxybacter fermentans]AZR73895.1 hypothetical protein BBF96_11145 [Anoxybacter fermentans]
MTFRIGGLSSGLDTSGLIEQLMQIERRPLVQLQNKQHLLELKKDLFSEINSSLSTLQSKVKNLLKNLTFNPVKASSNNENVVTITTDENAIVGTYELNVTKLATATSITSINVLNSAADTAASVTSSQTVSSSGSIDTTKSFLNAGFKTSIDNTQITVTINGISFSIDPSTTTVDQFMSEVNGSDAGVTISYDSTTDKFTIQSKDVGSDAQITISDNGKNFFEAFYITETTYKGSGTADPDAKLINSQIDGLTSQGGVFYFKINGYAFNFDENTHSLNDIINTVNNSDAGVNMIYDPVTDKIIISNVETGNNYIQFEDVQGNFLQAIGVHDPNDPNFAQNNQILGQEASFTLNGASMTRDSNEFEINGVTFKLQGTGSATVVVEKDIDAIYNSIKEFVDQYNSTIELLNTRLSEEKVEDATTDTGLSKGLLRGDSTLIGLRSALRQIVTENVSGLTNTYDSLMDIGITTTSDDFGKSGLLEIDETKLRDALEKNPDAVQKLFFEDKDGDETVDNGETGVAAKLYNEIQQYISTSTTTYNGRSYKVGIIPMRIDSLAQEIDRYDDQIETFEERLELVEARYWRQFTALEQALSQLYNQGNWLSSQLSTLPSYKNG